MLAISAQSFSYHNQGEREAQAQLLVQDFQLSKAQLEVHTWKRRSALLQLKLDSQQEDANHLQQFRSVLTEELHQQQQSLQKKESQHKAVLVSCNIRNQAHHPTRERPLFEAAN